MWLGNELGAGSRWEKRLTAGQCDMHYVGLHLVGTHHIPSRGKGRHEEAQANPGQGFMPVLSGQDCASRDSADVDIFHPKIRKATP